MDKLPQGVQDAIRWRRHYGALYAVAVAKFAEVEQAAMAQLVGQDVLAVEAFLFGGLAPVFRFDLEAARNQAEEEMSHARDSYEHYTRELAKAVSGAKHG